MNTMKKQTELYLLKFILNIFDFKIFPFSKLLFYVFKYIPSETNKFDRKTNSTLLNAIFRTKYNAITALRTIIKYADHCNAHILKTTDPSKQPIDYYCLTILNDFKIDMDKTIEILQQYTRNKNIQTPAFWEFLNNVTAEIYSNKAQLNEALRQIHLIDKMKRSATISPLLFMKANFDKFDAEQIPKTKQRNNNTNNNRYNNTSYNNNNNRSYNQQRPNYKPYNNNNHRNYQYNNNDYKSANYQYSNNKNINYNNNRDNKTNQVQIVRDKLLHLLTKLGISNLPNNICIFYNDGNRCKREQCTRNHSCPACNKFHPLTQCDHLRKLNSSNDTG